MKAVLRIIETWRCDSEEEAQNLIEEKTANCSGEISKKSIEYKTKSAKGVIVDEAYKVTIQADYNKMFDPAAEYTMRLKNDDEE